MYDKSANQPAQTPLPTPRREVDSLALGTAQFGFDYGISNTRGRVAAQTVRAIVRAAMASGVRTIDTAEEYGCSESVLGSALVELDHSFEVITKFPADVSGRTLHDHLAGSLARLHVTSLAGYLAHHPDPLLRDDVVSALRDARDSGLIRRFGASVNTPEDVNEYFRRDIGLELIQLPYSIGMSLQESGAKG